MIKIGRTFKREQLADVKGTVLEQLDRSMVQIPCGGTIAIAVGSRGITNLATIVKTTVEWVKKHGATPIVIPAMGSHGGATDEGQRSVLESYGLTENYLGAAIHSSLEVVQLPQGELTHKVYTDKFAFGCDGTILINRVKPHTDFHGPFESGLMKMAVIGLGNHKGAQEIHSYGVAGLKELIVPTARQVFTHGNIILGLAIVENAYHDSMVIEAIPTNQIEQAEMALLKCAKDHMPKLPVHALDILIVDQYGKNISGSGLDPNIIGRRKIRGEQEFLTPDIKVIVLADLTPESHGNAIGMGLADIMAKRIFEKIDFTTTYENVVTSSFLERGKMPIMADTDLEALHIAMRACSKDNLSNVRLARIRSTLSLDEMYISPNLLGEIVAQESVDILAENVEMFDQHGNLQEF